MGGAEGAGVGVVGLGADEDDEEAGFKNILDMEYTSIGSWVAIFLSPCEGGDE